MPAPATDTLKWELLLESDGRTGAENMAIDAALLEEADRAGRAFLRLYRWTPPALSLGRNEPALTRYDRAEVERRGLDVVRRPTGGRAVWHEHEVTYAVAAPVAAFGSLRDSYAVIHARLAAALRTLGAPAELAGSRRPAPLSAGACFAAPVGGEVVIRGRKVVGSAQVRQGAAFLQHGSILLDGSQEVVHAVSREPGAVPSGAREAGSRGQGAGATTLREALGRPVSFDEVAAAVIEAWDVFPSTVPYRPLPSSTVLFADPSWTWRR
jgi:lipoyl(octanoyl) transferase